MTQIGIVTKTEGDRAVVSVARASACEGCHRHAEGCTACSLLGGDNRHTAEVANPIGAKIGDRVEIEAPEGRVLAYAALVFLFPIALAILGYMIGCALFSGAPLQSALFAAGGFVLAFFVVFCVSLFAAKKTPLACIVNVINNREDEGTAVVPSDE